MEETGIPGDDRILSSYIDGLAARALGISQSILPRVPALFEPIRAMPSVLDAETAESEDKPVEIASSADDINRPLANQPLAKDFSRSPASENSLDIESGFKSAIDPTKKAPAQTANSSHEGLENTPIKRQDVLGHANPGSLQGQMIHFEQALGPVRVDQVSSDIEASQPNPSQAPNRNSDRNIDWKSQKLDDIAAEEAAEEATEDTGTFEPVVKGTVVDGMPSFKHGERRADIIPNKASAEAVVRLLDRESDESFVIKNTPNGVSESLGYANLESPPNQATRFGPDSRFSRVRQISSETIKETTEEIIEEATGDNKVKVYEHANMGNELSNVPSPELDQEQTIAVLEDIDTGTFESVNEGMPSSKNSEGKADTSPNKVSVETNAKVYEHASLGNNGLRDKLPPATSSKSDQKQTIAGSKSNDITTVKPLIGGTLVDAPVFKSSKMSVNKSRIIQPLMQNNASQPPEITSQPVIKVTIGRIEVKAVLPPDKKVQRQAPKAKSNSLEKYLLSIRGGSR